MGNSTIIDGISTGAIPKLRKVETTNESDHFTTIHEPNRVKRNLKKDNETGEALAAGFGFKTRSGPLKSIMKADSDTEVMIRRKRNVSFKPDYGNAMTAKKPRLDDSAPLIPDVVSRYSRLKRRNELPKIDEIPDAAGPSTSAGNSESKRFKKSKKHVNKKKHAAKCKKAKNVISDKPAKVIRKDPSEDEDELLKEMEKLNIGGQATPSVVTVNEMPDADPEASAPAPRSVFGLDKTAALNALNSLVVIKGLPISLINRYRGILAEYFQRYGHIQRIGVPELYFNDNNEQMFATTVYFDTKKAAAKALEMDYTVYDDSIIRVRRLFPFMDEIEEGRRCRRAYLTFEELGIHIATNPETQEEIVIMEDGYVRYDWEYSGSDSD